MALIKALYASFQRTFGWPLSVLATVLTVWAFFFAADDKIPTKHVILWSSIILVCFVTACDFGLHAFLESRRRLPEVIQGLTPSPFYKPSVALLLLRPSELFGHEALVSVYLRKNQVEILVGWGFVLTVQEEGMIQVLVREIPNQPETELWAKVTSGDKNTLAALIVKPSIPKTLTPNLS